jgi:hypothetical protein
LSEKIADEFEEFVKDIKKTKTIRELKDLIK